MLTDVWLLQFPHGSTLFSVEAVGVSLKEVTEQAASTSMILGISMSITWTGLLSRWKRMRISFLQPDNLQLLSTTLMIKDSTFLEVGLMSGSTTCGCFQLATLPVHLMLLTTSSQRSVPWQERQNSPSMVLDLSNHMEQLLSDSLVEKHQLMLKDSLKKKISSNAKLQTLNNLAQKNVRSESHAENTIWRSQRLILLISLTPRQIKLFATVQVFLMITLLMARPCLLSKPETQKVLTEQLVETNLRSRSKDWTSLFQKMKFWIPNSRRLLINFRKRKERKF